MVGGDRRCSGCLHGKEWEPTEELHGDKFAQSYELNATEDRGQSAFGCSLESPCRAMTIRDLMVHKAGFYYATTHLPCLNDAQAALEAAR